MNEKKVKEVKAWAFKNTIGNILPEFIFNDEFKAHEIKGNYYPRYKVIRVSIKEIK